jgi:F-type H+-transporting ATPase subunit b
MLTLNLNLLYTVVNILVLFLLLRKFLYKPVMNIIAQRQKQVDDALNAAETSKQEAAAALNDAQAKLRNVDAEAVARRTAYEQQAEKVRPGKVEGGSEDAHKHGAGDDPRKMF